MNTERNRLSKPRHSLPDAALIQAAVSGNREAREVLARACLPRVRRLVMLSSSRHSEAEDVVQVAMVHIFRDLHSLQSPEGFAPWSDRVTLNAVRTHGRKRIRFEFFHSSKEEMDVFPGGFDPADEIATRRSLFQRLSRHLDRIGVQKRDAAVLSIFFGYVDSEVAELVDCSVETAKKRIQHGRQELIRMLRNDAQCLELLREVIR